MYHSLLIIAVCIALSTTAQTYDPLLQPLQKHEISICYNSIYTVWNTKTPDDMKQYGEPKPGFGISFLFSKIMNRYINIQTGIMYHEMSYGLPIEKHKDYQLHLTNLQIPLLAVFNTDKFCCINYSIFVGPQFTYNLSSSYIPPESALALRDTTHVILSVSPGDIGIAYGAGGDIAINKAKTMRIDIGYRGSLGFTDRSGNLEEANQVNIIPQRTTINTFGGYLGFKMIF